MINYLVGPKWDRRQITIAPKGSIAILMSGGIDSYVLYNLIKNYDPTIYNINRADGFDRAWRVEQLTGKPVIRFDETTTNPDNRIKEAIWSIQKKHDQLYMGMNHIPPIYHFPEFADKAPHRPWHHGNEKLVTPFLHLYKYHIIELADQLSISLKDTHSCISNSSVECGECWQCREKQWGYEQLD